MRSLADPGRSLGGMEASTSGGGRHCLVLVCSRSLALRRRCSVRRHAVERDVDWEPELKRPMAPPPKTNFTPPPPPPQTRTKMPWWEMPFASRRNIGVTMLAGGAALWTMNNKVLPPLVQDTPPKDFPFKLAGYTDIDPSQFVYARTPGGHWVAAASDTQGRLYMIDEIGDLYYDSGDPQVGMYAMDTGGNLFNFYTDVDGSRRITPVGNIDQLQRFKISEIAGVKLDRDVNVVAFTDGTSIPLPPGAGEYDANGNFVPPGELVEGVMTEKESPFARVLGDPSTREYPFPRYEVDLNDPRTFDRQLFDQTLLDDPDLPGFQPALPKDFDLQDLARQVEEEAKRKRR